MKKKRYYKDIEELAKTFARFLVQEFKGKKQFNICLSGGSTPKLLFQILAKEYAKKVKWENIHFYWGDERCVKPTSKDSNYGMTKKLLLDHINIPKENIHRILGEKDSKAEAKRYAEEIANNLPREKGVPIFDLVILGMGSDGHTASIFPHQRKLWYSDKICVVATHPDSGQKRISITGEVINAARQVHFLTTGEAKKSVLKEILTSTGKYEKYPASYVTNAGWWMDAAAYPF